VDQVSYFSRTESEGNLHLIAHPQLPLGYCFWICEYLRVFIGSERRTMSRRWVVCNTVECFTKIDFEEINSRLKSTVSWALLTMLLSFY